MRAGVPTLGKEQKHYGVRHFRKSRRVQSELPLLLLRNDERDNYEHYRKSQKSDRYVSAGELNYILTHNV